MWTLLSYAPVGLSETLYAPLLLSHFSGQTLFDFEIHSGMCQINPIDGIESVRGREEQREMAYSEPDPNHLDRDRHRIISASQYHIIIYITISIIINNYNAV